MDSEQDFVVQQLQEQATILQSEIAAMQEQVDTLRSQVGLAGTTAEIAAMQAQVDTLQSQVDLLKSTAEHHQIALSKCLVELDRFKLSC